MNRSDDPATSDHVDLDLLLRDVVHERAGDPVSLPGPAFLRSLQIKGDTRRRRRRTAGTVAAAAAVLSVALLAVHDSGSDQVHTSNDSPTTTTTTAPPGPAIGAPAPSYIGVDLLAPSDGSGLWTAQGKPLTYLSIAGAEPVDATTTALFVKDGDHGMIWTVIGRWPDEGTVVDALDVNATLHDTAVGTDCTSSAQPGSPVIALVGYATPPDTARFVAVAWHPTPDDAQLEPLADRATVTCNETIG
jgi:hypothetical protein